MITRKYVIEQMINDKEFGRVNIVNSSEDFKSKLWKIIEEAKVSVPTVAVFLSFCEDVICKTEMADNYLYEDINLNELMLNASIFIANVMGFDFKRISEYVTKEDLVETSACWNVKSY